MNENKTINNAFIVKRKITIPRLVTDQDVMALQACFDGVEGVLEVETDQASHQLSVIYDETGIDFGIIENIIAEAGFPASDTVWSRLKRAYYRFTDENVQGHKEGSSSCCSHPQGIYNKQKK